MPIKQLQLRGISRTPSDRATADGGCAESLNVHLDQQETAPSLPPEDKSDEIYGDAERYQIVFVHKMLGVTNYIGHIPSVEGSTQGLYAYGENVTTHLMGGNIAATEELKHVTSIGNTLIAFTDAKPYYYLFKDGAYTFLGNAIPKPMVEVVTLPYDAPTYTSWAFSVGEDSGLQTGTPATWNQAKNPGNIWHADLLSAMENAWNGLKMMISDRRGIGLFSAPFFIRYALRLYDGSYIHVSTPILCGAQKSGDWARMWMHQVSNKNALAVQLTNLFRVRVKGNYMASEWSDIVTSIDFFASTPVYAPAVEAAFYKMDTTASTFPASGGGTESGWAITLDGMDDSAREKTIRDELLSKGQFFKIKSIEIDNDTDMRKLWSGEMSIASSENVSGDLLATSEELPATYRDGSQYIAHNDAFNFNSRLLMVGADEVLPTGDLFLNGQSTDGSSPSSTLALYKYEMRFKLVNPLNGMTNHVMARYMDGETTLVPACFVVSARDNKKKQYFGGDLRESSGFVLHDPTYPGLEPVTVGDTVDELEPIPVGDTYMPLHPYSWLCFPDTRCKEVELTFRDTSGTFERTIVIPMEEHPLLECSYAFLGFGVSLRDYMGNHLSDVMEYTADENRMMPAYEKLFLSEFENPFIFPAGNILTFKDELVGAATTSVPLSEGQLGDFTMYVFTEGGIRVLVPSSEGTFAAGYAHPNLSRHVALPGSILGLEQAVVFITERGVMMLSGNTVTEISRYMNGKPYALESVLSDLTTGALLGTEWAHLLPTVRAGETLMGFMTGARVAYDSNGARLIFFNPDAQQYPYQYVYMLETETWHKLFYKDTYVGTNSETHVATGIFSPVVINSYPDCLISCEVDVEGVKVTEVLNFSTKLDDASILSDTEDPVHGIIASRPFDLDETDIRKAIRSIRVRGRFNREDVQYVLFGSFDGLHWQRLTSLRGGSYKLYRIVLLTKLTATERISWIDIDYETRFTNKLR